MSLEESYKILRKGAEILALQNAQTKNRVLKIVKEALDKNRQKILAENAKDVKRARDAGVKASLVDRLSLDDKKINGILESMDVVIAQTDPIGEEVAGWKTPNGLCIRQVRVPLGVVGIIYESRPNVTVDAFCLAYKSGNSILLRGSSSAYASNRAIVDVIKEALDKAEGGDLHLINGSYTRLSEAGKAYGVNAVATTEKEAAQPEEAGEQETDSEGGISDDESDSREQSREAPGHARRRAERRALRQNIQPRRAGN
jgi:acyl-CoA reductase-like NAD-dependent aldehyde dehydrogenase